MLGSGGTLRSEAADDLVSLVRTLFSLQHPIMAEELSLVPKNSYGEIEEVWGKWMGGKRKWIAAQNAAAATDYQQVATQLSDLLDV